jgi:hypothetical protein
MRIHSCPNFSTTFFLFTILWANPLEIFLKEQFFDFDFCFSPYFYYVTRSGYHFVIPFFIFVLGLRVRTERSIMIYQHLNSERQPLYNQ